MMTLNVIEPGEGADPTRRTIALGPRAHELRAYVGTTLWAVLEEMMPRSTGDFDHVVAHVSIRSLASSLGLAKDTAARAVRRLRDLSILGAQRVLVAVHLAEGNISEARRQFHIYQDPLWDALAVEPSSRRTRFGRWSGSRPHTSDVTQRRIHAVQH